MRSIKKILIVMLTLMCVMNFNVYAQENENSLVGTIVDGSILTNENESTGSAIKVLRGYYLSDGSSYISDQGNGTVYISGSTSCYRTAEELRADVYLQRLVGNDWETVTYQHHSEYNTYYAHNGFYIAVARGYYYRTLTNHTAICGDTVEYLTSRTDWLYVD